MAYFSNGTEGMIFEDKFCDRCTRCGDCPVWEMHQLYNYDECNNKNSLLHKMIPEDQSCCYFFRQAKENPYSSYRDELLTTIEQIKRGDK